MTNPPALPLDSGTRLAVDRTRLAHERTMMAWVRTGASMISFGFTIYKFFEFEVDHGARSNALIGPREFAMIMIGIGVVALFLSVLEHLRSMKILNATYGPQPRSVAAVVGGLLSVMGLGAFVVALFRG